MQFPDIIWHIIGTSQVAEITALAGIAISLIIAWRGQQQAAPPKNLVIDASVEKKSKLQKVGRYLPVPPRRFLSRLGPLRSATVLGLIVLVIAVGFVISSDAPPPTPTSQKPPWLNGGVSTPSSIPTPIVGPASTPTSQKPPWLK
jgi:hypothetical protein